MNDRTTTSRLCLAFLGCGYTARRHSRTLARAAPGVQRFYASRRRGAACELVSRYRGAGWFNSYQAALADPRIDAAFVTSTPLLHLELTLAALDAGKHVIVDQPAFLHPDDYTLAGLAAERAGRQLLVADTHFYSPLAERLRALIAAGTLGDIRLLQVNALAGTGPGRRPHLELTGGSALLEASLRWIGFLAHLGLTIDSIQGFRPPAGRTPERSALLVCEYRQAALGLLSYSRELASGPGLCISGLYGTRGRALFDSGGRFLLVLARGFRLSLPGLADRAGYAAMHRDFLRALATATTPRYTLALARRDIALAQQACAAEPWPITGPSAWPASELPPRLCLTQSSAG